MAQRMLPQKSSDLLDVMRGPSAPRNAGGIGRGSGASSTGTGGGASGGMRIGRRQAMLGLTAMGLVVALAFTIGMSVGRRHGTAPGTADLTLARASITSWVIRGWVPSVSPVTAGKLESAIPKDLAVRMPGLQGRVRTERADPRRDGPLTVIVTGFSSPEEAQRVLDVLAMWSVESCVPFRSGVVEPGR